MKKSRELALNVFGCVIYGVSVEIFLSPYTIAPGGVSGISVLLNRFLPVGVGTLIILLNIPLLVTAFKNWGRRFTLLTAFSIVISGFAADISAKLPRLEMNPLPAAVFGGALMGTGCAMVFRSGSTTGGTDIAARLIKKRRPYLKISTAIMLVDGVISLLSGVIIRNADTALYSLLALFLSTRAIDFVLYGGNSAKLIIVISRKGANLAEELTTAKNVGCTLLDSLSGYKGERLYTLLCAVRKQRFPEIRDYILKEDTNAFLLVSDTAEIFGEGFLQHSQGKDFL